MSGRPSPLVRRLLIGAVALAVAALFLVGWVWSGYEVSVQTSGPVPAGRVSCDAKFDGDPTDPAFQEFMARFDQACDDARADRTRTALLLGAALVVAVAVVTTIPSKRLMRLAEEDEPKPSA